MGNAPTSAPYGHFKHQVHLAVTPIGPPVAMMQAYHTSIVVDDMEFSFSNRGLSAAPGLMSHMNFQTGQPQVFCVGATAVSPQAMMQALMPFFRAGSYDFLRKNCNSFSDCSLFYMLGQRLESQYRILETISAVADRHLGIVRALSGGDYQPNPQADDFEEAQNYLLAQGPKRYPVEFMGGA
mmetsp:Transcript_760/g.1894  ORF Transcript_760/g.1894 Transcript_760/m.1894 type:complete len:182 (-) Transcript_760:28-573(-)